MLPNNNCTLQFLLICTLILLGWSQLGSAGVVIISGDDADEDGHCYRLHSDGTLDGTLCGSLYPNALNLAIGSSTSPGTGIVAIGGANCGTAGLALTAWNDPANGGPGAAITFKTSTTAITSVNLSDFAMIYVPSIHVQLGGFCGLEDNQLAALNTLGPQIQNFVNVLGGSVVALIEADDDNDRTAPIINPWGWLPFPFVTTPTSFRNVTTTVNMPLVSPTTDAGNLSHSAFHMVFETPLPSGFLSLANAADGPNIPPEHIGKPTYLIANIITPENCSDGIDNDGDGLIDKNDPDCLICGDGFLDAPLEQCDDGNLASGDGCDMFCKLEGPLDTDGDGIEDDADNCPDTANSDQTDTDYDGAGNACDPDDDDDGVADGTDNCPLIINSDQDDFDGDGAGDLCDTDADSDEVLDAVDACLFTPAAAIINTDGCAIADLCPCIHPDGTDKWKNHGKYVSCVAHAANDFRDAGLISDSEHGDIVSEAGQSACGVKN